MAPGPILRNALLSLEPAEGCGVPGYLILRLAGPAVPLGELPAADAAPVMTALARAAAAIERVVGAERVYLLSFCEVDRRLHFHLFPRTAWLLDAYRAATGDTDAQVNGPRLFEWARTAYAAGCDLPAGSPTVDEAAVELRRRLADPT